MQTARHTAQVVLFSGFEKELSYSVPEHLKNTVKIGSLVRVALRNSFCEALVVDLKKDFSSSSEFTLESESENEQKNFNLKPIASLIREESVFTKELYVLAKWMRDYYSCSLQSAFEAMLPAVVRSGKGALSVLEIKLKNIPDADALAIMKKRAPKQFEIYEYLQKNKFPMLKNVLAKTLKISTSVIDALVKKNILIEYDREINRTAFDDEFAQIEKVQAKDFDLNHEQQSALDDISKLLDKSKFSTHLLYGVTGSGKTEVYIRSMRKVLQEGNSCIFLVPEISLTAQTVGRLRSRLQDCNTELVVWHSNLSDGERIDAWKAMSEGKARVVVGARSSIFAPLKNLKLIIVDEEHDSAYKQESVPRYNARDLAVYRASLNNALVLLGSATPCLETLYNVKIGKYSQSRINNRIDGAYLPKVIIIDLKHEKPNTILSNILREKIIKRLEANEQCILFLNRRGYSKVFECPDCGNVETCPNCSITLTWHKNDNYTMCHLCGHKSETPFRCSKCYSQKARWKSYGTQKIEEYIRSAFPTARIARMDADTMKKKDKFREILSNFRAGNLDILIGTQMIAKGLDFPRVTLVGIINADISLNMQDFRAGEKTYQLIVQVAGRAGRGVSRGEVIVQTMNPDAPPIQYAKSAELESFLEEELANRMKFNYPPSQRLIRQIFRSRNPDKLAFYCEEYAKKAQELLGNVAQIRGPAPAPLEKQEEYYRWHIWYFCNSVKSTVAKINELRKNFKMDKDIDDLIDVDPQSLM